MIVQLNTAHSVSLYVKDDNNNLISNDTPYVIVKDIHSNNFWNGISWQSTEFHIIMNYIAEGAYQYNFIPNKPGEYSLTAKSDKYPNCIVHEDIQVGTGNGEDAQVTWLINTPFIIQHEVEAGDLNVPSLTIILDTNGTYWNGTAWQTEPYNLTMDSANNKLYYYSFTPKSATTHSIIISSEMGYSKNIVLTVKNVDDQSAFLTVSNLTLQSIDGLDSTIYADNNQPLGGVTVSVYKVSDNSLVKQVISNQNGEWSLSIHPGIYYFMFVKEGYISTGFQRMVS